MAANVPFNFRTDGPEKNVSQLPPNRGSPALRNGTICKADEIWLYVKLDWFPSCRHRMKHSLVVLEGPLAESDVESYSISLLPCKT
jgi:hypothetical protein